MKVRILGSAAGGGFPQWNCNCPNCAGLRQGSLRARARTQSSIALSGDGTDWVLFNASPDLLQQIQAFPALQPARSIRDTAIRAVVLVDAQIDHTLGLLLLREGPRLNIYCTEMVRADLTAGNPLLGILSHFCGTEVHTLSLESPASSRRPGIELPGVPGLRVKAIPLDGKAPPFSPHREDPHPGDNVGLWVEDSRSGRTLFYAPGLAQIGPGLQQWLHRADCLMLDGTFWTDEEMIQLGVSHKRAREIGHLPQSGPGGMLEALAPLDHARRILIHINNTNPILNEDSPERRQVEQAGIEVAFDGMAFDL